MSAHIAASYQVSLQTSELLVSGAPMLERRPVPVGEVGLSRPRYGDRFEHVKQACVLPLGHRPGHPALAPSTAPSLVRAPCSCSPIDQLAEAPSHRDTKPDNPWSDQIYASSVRDNSENAVDKPIP